MAPHIVGVRGTHAGNHFPLGDSPVSFGRSPENTLALTSARSSRRHAEIRREGNNFVLVDLGSANGTLVNGQRISGSHRLHHGDTFEIGDDTFRFDSPAVMDATLVAPPVMASPPTTPVAPQQTYQPPMPPVPIYQPPPSQPGQVPPANQPKRSTSKWLLIGGLIGLVLLVGCIGGAVAISRNFSGIASTLATPAAASTPAASKPTPAASKPTPAATEPTSAPDEPQPTSAPAPTREPVTDGADWTILVYLDGDNNLEHAAVVDYAEMAKVGSNDRVKIVVLFDRIKQDGAEDDDSNGDWTTTKRFLVEKGKPPTEKNQIDDLGELNMGDPQTLVDFIDWGVKAYPAKHYALILWDHGGSWQGIAFDDSSDEKGISMPELEAALRTANQRFDLIGFDACLMAQLDVMLAIEPYGDVAVASAELEPSDGWAWDAWLAKLVEDPNQDAATIATTIVETYRDFYQDGEDTTVTLSAFDLSRMKGMRDDLSTLADAMSGNLDNSYEAIAEARSYVDNYGQTDAELISSIDLGHFAQLIQRRGKSSAKGDVTAAAKAIYDSIAAARIAEWNGGFHSNSSGMAIFFPQYAETYPDVYDQLSPVPQQTSWGKFLKAFHGAGTEQVSVPQITDLQLSKDTVSVNDPVTLEGNVSGNNIAHVFFFAGIPNDDRTSVTLTDIDYIYPPGSIPGDSVPPWDDGTNGVVQNWNGAQWGLTNGTDTIPVLLGPAKYGTDLYGVEGIYKAQNTNEEINAGLLFRVEQGRATLTKVYGFPRGQNEESQPFEIDPSEGDTFTAQLRTYTDNGDKLEPGQVQGDTITFGSDPLSAERIGAPSGSYVIGLLVRDISGRFSYEYQDITVDNSGANSNPNVPLPTPAPGAQSGTLAYENPELAFSLEYPETWETLDNGNSQIFFYPPDGNGNVFITVGAYSLNQPAETANRKLLDEYLKAMSKQDNFQNEEIADGEQSGETGPSARYTYTDGDGVNMSGATIAITSPRTEMTYLIVVQAPEDEMETQLDIFQKILETLKIE